MIKPRLLNAIIILLVLNAVVAAVHYLLIFAGVMPASDDLVIIKEFAVKRDLELSKKCC